MIDRNRYENLADALSSVIDLEALKRAITREETIRRVMAGSGESREIVVSVMDADASMGQEGVLNLTDGQPTTLRAALERYIEEAERTPPDTVDAALMGRDVADDLRAILDYPCPGDKA